MKKIFTVLLVCSGLVFAGEKEKNTPYISFQGGTYNTKMVRFDNGPVFVLALGAGLPVYKNVSFYNKFSYFSRTDYTPELDINNVTLTADSKLEVTNASFSQMVYNSGLQLKLPLPYEINFTLSGGMTYAMVSHEAKFVDGAVTQTLDKEGVFGYFWGFGLEKRPMESNISYYAEGIYNHVSKDIVYFNDKFSGMNITVGARYYFRAGE